MQEEWRPIVGWPYAVSDRGRVRRTEPGDNGHRNAVGRVLKPTPDVNGYHRVLLSRHGERRLIQVHVLVLTAFVGPPEIPSLQTRHLDGSRTNNVPENLAWGTTQENIDDRGRHGRWRDAIGRLTAEQVAEIRRRHAEAPRDKRGVKRGFMRQLAAEFGFSISGLEKIVYGVAYQHVTLDS